MPFDSLPSRDDSLFRDLLESAPDAMVIVDHDGTIVLVNSQTERLFGYRREDLLGRSIEVLVPERFRPQHSEHRRNYFAEPRPRGMGAGLDLSGLRHSGEEFPVEISLSPLRTSERLLVSASIRDVTERRRVERVLQEKNIELERASAAKDRFLASMSHELRTPLNAIIGFTGTLLMRLPGPLTSEQQHQLETVRSSARHLLSLINELLDLAKIESGSIELRPEPVRVEDVVHQVINTLRPLAEAKGLVLGSVLPPGGVMALADERALHQILLNLTNNAIKFTERGFVRVELGVTDAPERPVEIAVIDTGIGISPEDQAQLFKAFTPLTGASGRSDGTGLGLHLSQKLADLLNGTIRFTSAPGQGSTFTLALPRG